MTLKASMRISFVLMALYIVGSLCVVRGTTEMPTTESAEVSMASTHMPEETLVGDIAGLGVVSDLLGESGDMKGSVSGFLKNMRGGDDGVLKTIQRDGQHKCEAGRTFKIKTEEDLVKISENGDEECLFAVGKAPIRPPIGLYFGQTLKLFHSARWNNRIEHFWGGKLGFKSQCRRENSKFYMAINFLANNFDMPALMYIGTLRDRINEDDYDDEKESLFIDYTVNMEKVCPLDPSESHNFNLGIVNPKFPVNKVTDLVRYVGKLENGGHIMLGKTFGRDMLKFPNKGDRAVAFWYVVNYDDAAYPVLPGTLGPIPETFHYRHANIEEFMTENVLNFGDLLESPITSLLHLTDMMFSVPKGLPPKDPETKEVAEANVLSGIPSNKAVKDRYFNGDEVKLDNVRFEKSGRVSF